LNWPDRTVTFEILAVGVAVDEAVAADDVAERLDVDRVLLAEVEEQVLLDHGVDAAVLDHLVAALAGAELAEVEADARAALAVVVLVAGAVPAAAARAEQVVVDQVVARLTLVVPAQLQRHVDARPARRRDLVVVDPVARPAAAQRQAVAAGEEQVAGDPGAVAGHHDLAAVDLEARDDEVPPLQLERAGERRLLGLRGAHHERPVRRALPARGELPVVGAARQHDLRAALGTLQRVPEFRRVGHLDAFLEPPEAQGLHPSLGGRSIGERRQGQGGREGERA
jgi:hypothetical protein